MSEKDKLKSTQPVWEEGTEKDEAWKRFFDSSLRKHLLRLPVDTWQKNKSSLLLGIEFFLVVKRLHC